MRVLAVVTSLLFATTGAWADEATSLSAQEVARDVAPSYPQIKACYLTHARHDRSATGELSLKLVIHRNGSVRDVAIEAPGVTGAALKDLESCVRLEALAWRFPARRFFTTAVVPYLFLLLDPPGAGPQYSCWNPHGCPTKP